jgi:hypothetical protein
MAPALDRIPQDWHVLTVCRAKARGRDWVALMNDEPPDPEHASTTWDRLRSAIIAFIATSGCTNQDLQQDSGRVTCHQQVPR